MSRTPSLGQTIDVDDQDRDRDLFGQHTFSTNQAVNGTAACDSPMAATRCRNILIKVTIAGANVVVTPQFSDDGVTWYSSGTTLAVSAGEAKCLLVEGADEFFQLSYTTDGAGTINAKGSWRP